MASTGRNGGSGFGSGTGNSNSGSPALGGTQSAVQMVNAIHAIPLNDDPKWPLWRYVQKVAKAGGGQGVNAKIICRLCPVILLGATQE